MVQPTFFVSVQALSLCSALDELNPFAFFYVQNCFPRHSLRFFHFPVAMATFSSSLVRNPSVVLSKLGIYFPRYSFSFTNSRETRISNILVRVHFGVETSTKCSNTDTFTDLSEDLELEIDVEDEEIEILRQKSAKPRKFPLLGNGEKKELRAYAHKLGKKLVVQHV